MRWLFEFDDLLRQGKTLMLLLRVAEIRGSQGQQRRKMMRFMVNFQHNGMELVPVLQPNAASWQGRGQRYLAEAGVPRATEESPRVVQRVDKVIMACQKCAPQNTVFAASGRGKAERAVNKGSPFGLIILRRYKSKSSIHRH